jgi:hypothetical protein
MRQAGRYMAAFREYSDKYPFRMRSETPEIAIELSLQVRPPPRVGASGRGLRRGLAVAAAGRLCCRRGSDGPNPRRAPRLTPIARAAPPPTAPQPWRAFKPDGVIFFSDILTPLPAIGVEFDVIKGKGPVISNPVRSMDDLRALRTLDDPGSSLKFTGETLAALRCACRSGGGRACVLAGGARRRGGAHCRCVGTRLTAAAPHALRSPPQARGRWPGHAAGLCRHALDAGGVRNGGQGGPRLQADQGAGARVRAL